MKEAKRYSMYVAGVVGYVPNNHGRFVKYTDHKAVVERMQNTIDQYEEGARESNRFARILMSEKKELQNKIDELEAENKSLKICETCRYEEDDINSPCSVCFSKDKWEFNWVQIAKGIK